MFAQFCRNERMRAMAETSHSLTPAPRPATTWRRRQLATLSCLIHHCIAQKQPMQEIELLRPKAQAQLQPNGQQSTPLNGQEEAPLNVRRTAMEGMSSDRFFDANVLEELPHWSANWTVAHHTVSNGGTAIAIDGFLPMHTAASFHAELQSSWQASAPCRMLGQCKSKSCAWLYTNNDKGGNGKVRSVWNVAERREHAKLLYQGRRFSYSKWELSDQHSLHAAVSVLMESKAVRNAIGKLVGLDTTATPLGNISDYFITAYDTGDFLSTHNDGYSGSLAWVFHLSPEWKSEHGGQLRFNPSTRSGLNIGARDFEPSFNRLLLFRTRPAALAHQVLPVSRPAGAHPRFAFTGWYMMPNDVMSAEGLKQLQLMRSASAAGTHDMCV